MLAGPGYSPGYVTLILVHRRTVHVKNYPSATFRACA